MNANFKPCNTVQQVLLRNYPPLSVEKLIILAVIDLGRAVVLRLTKKTYLLFGYIVNGAKSWLIMKNSELAGSAKKVFDDEVNTTLEGRRHLGAVIGSKEFKNQCCQEKVDKWLREIESLAEISKSQPHAAYVAFTKGFKSKFTYYLGTIKSFEEYVDPIEEVIHTFFLPSLFGQAEPLPEELQELVNLSPAQGGIGIPDLKRESS